MKRQLTVTIQRVDNGFIVQASSDTPTENGRKIAETEDEAGKIATEFITAALATPIPVKP